MKQYRARKIKIAAGGRDLSLLVLQPLQPAFRKTPGIVWLHGGGYALGMPEMVYLSRALPLVERYGAVVVSPRYRLAARHPYPAALEDCYAALQYLKAHAEELGCASNQIMVGGESAGGGLAAALCMLARDRGEVRIAFSIYFPLCLPVLATIALFYAIGYWNNYFNAVMLVNNEDYYSLQMLLFKIQSEITALSNLSAGAMQTVNPPKESFKMATSVITMGPIIILYPFLQKYFVKGMVVGAVKG